MEAIQKDSYGYQLWLSDLFCEIQKAGPVEDWRWVEDNLSISDIITRGASPEELDEKSEWQRGPEFLKWPEAEVTRAQSQKISNPSKTDVGVDLEDSMKEDDYSILQLPPNGQGPNSLAERPKSWGVGLVRVVEPKRFSTLSKLCGIIAWT